MSLRNPAGDDKEHANGYANAITSLWSYKETLASAHSSAFAGFLSAQQQVKLKSKVMTEAGPLSRPYRRERCEVFCNYFPVLLLTFFSHSDRASGKERFIRMGGLGNLSLNANSFAIDFFAYSLLLGIFFRLAELATEEERHIKQLVRQQWSK